MTPLELVLSRLPDAKKLQSEGWKAKCPAHDDRTPSLSVKEGDKQAVVLNCFAGCGFEAILRALGLDPKDFKPERDRPHGKKTTSSKRPITLQELARDKALPVNFLTSVGLHDLPKGGVGIPYF